MPYNSTTRLAPTAGEHNARRSAIIAHARINGGPLEQIDAAFIPTLACDGFGDFRLGFDGEDEVRAIQRPMIAAYQAEHGVNWFVANDATRWAAFQEWDRRRDVAFAACIVAAENAVAEKVAA